MPMAQDTMLQTLYVIMRDVLMFLARYETVAGQIRPWQVPDST